MGTEIRLLGDVEVRVDGQPIALGPLRQRQVLAALLVEANKPVPVGKLVDRVWGSGRPHIAKETLYSHLSRLRRALEPASEVALGRQSGGYVLAVDPAAVDLYRFEQLVTEARGADDERAAALFTRALGLWRGEALAGLDSPWFDSVRTALNRQLLEAELDRNDVALRCGRPGGLLAELQSRAEAYPLDERLAGQLMLALYRNGRAAEALGRYEWLRRYLAEELGTDPGPALRRLHQRILVMDPALPGPSAAAPPRPRQLPTSTRHFTGRARELARLSKALGSGAERNATVPLSIIRGAGGIGKTSLALHWTHQNTALFPDGQLYLDLHGFDPTDPPMPPVVALRAFLDALGVPAGAIPAGLDAQTGLYRSLVAGKRILVVLDNARDTAQVTPLLPGDPACTVLVTSRHQLGALVTSHGAVPLELGVLDEGEARQLLTSHLGHDRVDASPEALRELQDWCSGLPLALSIVGAQAAGHPDFPLAALAEELREATTRLDSLDAGELSANLRAVFSCSYAALDPETADLFGLVGLAPGTEIGLPAAVALAGLPATRVRLLLRNLEHSHLIQQYKPARYRMHDLVRLYARERAGHDHSELARNAAIGRLVDHYLHTAHAGERLLRPHGETITMDRPDVGSNPRTPADPVAALAWFDVEHACLLATHRLVVGLGRHRTTWQLAWAMDTFHYRRGHRLDNVAVWRAGLEAAEHLADPLIRMLAHRRLGRACSVAHLHAEALDHLERALALAEQAGDLANRAHTQITLGWAWELQDEDGRALAYSREALRLFQALGDPVWEAVALNAVGWYSARLGRYDDARACCEQALALNRRNGNRAAEASTLDSLGYIAHGTGQYAQAQIHYRDTLVLYREFGDRYSEADTLARLGEAHAASDQPGAALRALQQALHLYQTQHRSTDAERIGRWLAALGGSVN